MKAIFFSSNHQIQWGEVDTPVPTHLQVRIKIEATAINRADLAQRAGIYPPPPGASDIPGLECVGIIDAIGPGVSHLAVGDRVCALLTAGGYAEYVCCLESHCLLMPINADHPLDFAALPEALATAWLNIFMETKIKPTDTVLIHAGASGVGTAAIQLCRAFDHPCAVTVGSQDKLNRCLDLGADHGIVRHEERFMESLITQTNRKGFDIILCPVGAQYLEENIKALNTDGRLVLIGLMGGRKAELDMGRLLIRRIRIIGSTLRSRSDAEKTALISQLKEKVWPLVLEGKIKPIIDTRYSISDIESAYQLIESNQTFGKVTLIMK